MARSRGVRGPDALRPQLAGRAGADPSGAESVAIVEAYLGSLFDYLPAPLLLTDPQGRIIRANPGAQRLLGGGFLLGRHVCELLPFVGRPCAAGGAWVGELADAPGCRLQVRRGSIGSPPAAVQLYLLAYLPAPGPRRRLPVLART